MTVAIIGGSGFIGTELTRQLLEASYEVRILDKNPSTTFPKLWTRVDVRDADRLRTTLEGCHTVYNLAAEHKDNVQPRSLYDEVNVGGARNVCTAATACGIERLVFTSSVAVYGFAPPDTDETGKLDPFNDYGRTKLEAEGIYSEWLAESSSRSLTIVRPTVVFGPRNRGNVYNLLRQMASGRFAMVGSGKNVKSMAFLENIGAFLVRVLELDQGRHLFNYIDKPDLSMNELVELVRERLGKPGRVSFHLPYALGYAGGVAFDAVARLTRREFPVSAIRVKKFCSTTQFCSSRVDATGFEAPFSLRDGLERTIDYEFLGGSAQDAGPRVIFESE